VKKWGTTEAGGKGKEQKEEEGEVKDAATHHSAVSDSGHGRRAKKKKIQRRGRCH